MLTSTVCSENITTAKMWYTPNLKYVIYQILSRSVYQFHQGYQSFGNIRLTQRFKLSSTL